MAKTLSDINFTDLLPESIKHDATISAAAQALDGEIQAVNSLLDVPALLARLDDLPEPVVDYLAWQFHVDFWDTDMPLPDKRNSIRKSIGWHKYKGTPAAVKQLLSRAGFADVEVIEFWQARLEYGTAGGVRLDGAWTLGGLSVEKLVPYESITGLPYMGHWAEFCVKLNLAESRWPGWNKDLIRAVDVAKPARSWPVWLYWLYMTLFAGPEHTYSMQMQKSVDIDYPWCTPQLDGSWPLGVGGYFYTLDVTNALDGTWSVGQLTPTTAEKSLKQCNIFTNLSIRKEIVRPAAHIAARLGEGKLFLNGGWHVGQNHVAALSDANLHKSTSIPVKPSVETLQSTSVDLDYPASPQTLDSVSKLGTWRSLDGGWMLSRTMRGARLDGAWPVRREPGLLSDYRCSCRISSDIGPVAGLATYAKVGRSWSRRLDGAWYVGARHDLDGTWPLKSGYMLGAASIGEHYAGVDGSWKIGRANRKLGGFSLGQPGVECEAVITIH